MSDSGNCVFKFSKQLEQQEQDNFVEALRLAYRYALRSPDTSTQNGAVVFGESGMLMGVGVNEFTKGVEPLPELLERPTKYHYIEHAERNAIYNAYRNGLRACIDDSPRLMVVAWAACSDCARAIVQSDIRILVRHKRDVISDQWSESICHGDEILKLGGVDIIEVEGKIGGCEPILVHGELWTP